MKENLDLEEQVELIDFGLKVFEDDGDIHIYADFKALDQSKYLEE